LQTFGAQPILGVLALDADPPIEKPMRLSNFILQEMEAILAKWETFAATQLPAATRMDSLALRDHAEQILQAVAKDIATSQTRDAQADKSMGRAPKPIDATETAAQTHALLRARSGFDINQLAAEYRALRASVLRLWMDACSPESSDLDDIVRFNEAIDQAIAESIGFFSAQVDQARNLFLGMLGHDMRSPLQTIQTTATYLAALNAGEQVSDAASVLISSGARMKALLDDLVEFNRTKLGLGIKVTPDEIDVAKLFAAELARLRAAYPQHRIELAANGDCRGQWDGARLQQLLDNLVVNAIKYGAPDAPVRVLVEGRAGDLHFEIRNSGPVMEERTLLQMFDPLRRGLEPLAHRDDPASLGLGLYIAREIAKAHGGNIEARSDHTETVFAVDLPRRPPHG
jgi:signal transduction histidine kinase